MCNWNTYQRSTRIPLAGIGAENATTSSEHLHLAYAFLWTSLFLAFQESPLTRCQTIASWNSLPTTIVHLHALQMTDAVGIESSLFVVKSHVVVCIGSRQLFSLTWAYNNPCNLFPKLLRLFLYRSNCAGLLLFVYFGCRSMAFLISSFSVRGGSNSRYLLSVATVHFVVGHQCFTPHLVVRFCLHLTYLLLSYIRSHRHPIKSPQYTAFTAEPSL